MGRRSDLEAEGTRFDSQRAQVTFFGRAGSACSLIFTHVWTGLGTLVGRVWNTFWSDRGHLCVKFGMSWDVSGSGLETFLDRFGKVLGEISGEVRKKQISKNAREYFPKSGRFKLACLTV